MGANSKHKISNPSEGNYWKIRLLQMLRVNEITLMVHNGTEDTHVRMDPKKSIEVQNHLVR